MRSLTKVSLACFVLTSLCLVYGSATIDAQDKKKEAKVKVGDPAPAFTSVDENGKTFKSADVVGKKVLVLYFYPADFTGGCTSQACAFRDDIEKLNSKSVMVVGVSADSVETHKLFKAHHKLPFTLLADEKGELAKSFGVPFAAGKGKATGINEKGEKIDVIRAGTIQRWTVVIDKKGSIAAIDNVGKGAADDAKRVLDIVSKLEKN
jgi:peroxiredoxin Q/BCP